MGLFTGARFFRDVDDDEKERGRRDKNEGRGII